MPCAPPARTTTTSVASRGPSRSPVDGSSFGAWWAGAQGPWSPLPRCAACALPHPRSSTRRPPWGGVNPPSCVSPPEHRAAARCTAWWSTGSRRCCPPPICARKRLLVSVSLAAAHLPCAGGAIDMPCPGPPFACRPSVVRLARGQARGAQAARSSSGGGPHEAHGLSPRGAGGVPPNRKRPRSGARAKPARRRRRAPAREAGRTRRTRRTG